MTGSEVHAPKDPTEKGKFLYLLYRTKMTAICRSDGTCLEEIDLDTGRLREKLRMMNDLRDEEFLKKFDSTSGFRSVISQIGISISANGISEVSAEWIMFGKKSRYGSGTHLRAQCPCDGREVLLKLDDAVWSEDDDTSGQLRIFFEAEGQQAEATILLYVKPGYDFPQPMLEAPVDFSGRGYQTLLERSLYSAGNNARLKAAFAKAQSGQKLTLAFIGGSITQGAGAKPIHTNCYSYLAWKDTEKLLGCPVTFVKNGIGGTPSELGMIRMEHDILRKGIPDIIVIEFAVNDNDDETQGRCYETLVRKALSLPGKPAVVLLFSVFCDDWNLQDRLAPIGRYYHLPMVSVLDAVVPQFRLSRDAGCVISKRQYFYDSYHPTNEGHRVMADCLTHMFRTVMEAPGDEEAAIPDKPFTGRTFDAVRLIDRSTEMAGVICGGFSGTDQNLQGAETDDVYRAAPQFTENWMHTAESGDEPFSMRLRCSSLFLVEKDSSEDDFGAAEIFVDGKLCRTVNPHQVGWIHCGALLIFESDVQEEHIVRISMKKEDVTKKFTILGFGVC